MELSQYWTLDLEMDICSISFKRLPPAISFKPAPRFSSRGDIYLCNL
jgi:hypothetical protein